MPPLRHPSKPAEPPLPVLLQRMDEDRRRRYRENLAFYRKLRK